MANATVEQAIIAEVTQSYFTADKIKAMAAKVGPQLEKAMIQSVVEYFEGGYLDDKISDVLFDVDFESIIKELVSVRFGLTTTKKGRR